METISQRGGREHYDALVIGSGLAGLTFCLELLQHRPQTRIALISKNNLSESNSYYAQGGIAAVAEEAISTGNNDSLQQHIDDTLAAGDGLVDQEIVRSVLTQSPAYIQRLKEYGVPFDKNVAGKFDLTREGGHSQRRIFHYGDQTGRAVIETLIAKIHAEKNIHIFESHTAISLLLQNKKPQPGDYGEVIGAYVLDANTHLIHSFIAPVTVLATGGAGKTYRYTTNPDVATGDGIAIAYRAGARVGNMEFYQFHPTLLYSQQQPNFLISEAVRGEGGYLRSVKNGERFMVKYAPEKMELATRDIVARAVFNEIENSAYNYVHLDITHRSKSFLQQHFPNIYNTLLQTGIDMSQDMIPIVPAAHYLCGGVLANHQGRTDKKRLYAIGEVTFTGFHGANRLASNSLLEAGITAQFAAKDCLPWLGQPFSIPSNLVDWNSQGVTDLRRASQLNAHWRGLRGEMTSYAGIIRTEAGLKDLLQLIMSRQQMIEEYYWKYVVTRDVLELRNIILVAELIVRSALQRRESRGGHYREDFPQKNNEQKTVIFQFNGFCNYSA
jgi:L-aspartate oxidase